MKKTLAATVVCLLALTGCGGPSYDTELFEKVMMSESGVSEEWAACAANAVADTDALTDTEKKRIFNARSLNAEAITPEMASTIKDAVMAADCPAD